MRPKAAPPVLDQAPSQKKELGHILMEQVEQRKIARKQARMEAFLDKIKSARMF